MKKEQVKVGMVVYDRFTRRYVRVESVCADDRYFRCVMADRTDKIGDEKEVMKHADLRPLTARERGDTQ